MEEVKVVIGVMDTESTPETVDVYDYISALNVTNTLQGDSETNYLTSIEGNRKVSTYKPLGQNKVIGVEYIKELGKVFFVRYNSLMYHQIVEFDSNTLEERIIFENRTDSANEDILELNASSYFRDIKIVGDNLLLLNDSENEIRLVDIKRDRSVVEKKEDSTLIKQPLPYVPSVKYVDNPTVTINNLRGKLFQFKTQVEYKNNLTSSWSHTSDRVVPINEPADGQGQNTLLNNSLELTISLKGVSKPETIRIATRAGNDNWLLVREIKYEDILKLPSTIEWVQGESYNPSTQEYKMIFKNDGAYTILDQVDVNNLYDSIPNKAEAVEVVNGNVVAIGGYTEGYDNTDIKVTSQVRYYDPNIKSVVTDPSSDRFRYVGGSYTSGSNYIEYYNGFTGKPKQGDSIILKINLINEPQNIQDIEYLVTLTDENDGLKKTLQNAVNLFNSRNIDKIVFSQTSGTQYEYIDYREYLSGGYRVNSLTVNNKNIGTLSTQSVNSLKNNSSYQVSLNLYDKYMRPFPIITNPNMKVNTSSLALTKGFLPEIITSIEGIAPEGARYYRWGITENRNTRKYVTLTGTVNTENIGDYVLVNLKSLKHINANEKESVLNYEYTNGDKVNFLRIINAEGDTVRWFDSPVINLDVIGFQVEATDTETNYFLRVRGTSLLNNYLSSLTGNEVVLEIYSPKAEDDENNSVFYEIGETYDILNGEFTVKSVSNKTGDSYYRGRVFRSSLGDNKTISQLVADPNFSDNYISNFWSNGTPRTVEDTKGRETFKANIRYSGERIHGSMVNEINKFYLERVYGEVGGETTRKHGFIRGMVMRNNTLVIIQEFKVGVIPVYRSVIEDNENNFLVADTGKIFGSVRYRTADLGCGDSPTSISKSGGVIYFVDTNECVPCRDTESNGTESIAGKMLNFFKEFINIAKFKGSKILGMTHTNKGEYIISIEEKGEELTTLSFEDSTTEDALPPLNTVTLGETTKGTTTYDPITGEVTYTHNTEDLGRDDIVLIIDGAEEKVIPLNIIEGDKVPNQFNFIPANNVEKNTLIESNSVVISGINTTVPVSVLGGEYSKNGGSYTSQDGYANDGDTFKVKGLSSNTETTLSKVTLTVGGVQGDFNITTKPDNVSPTNVFLRGEMVIENGRLSVIYSVSSSITDDIIINSGITYEDYGSTFNINVPQTTIQSGTTSKKVGTSLMVGANTRIISGTIRSTLPMSDTLVYLSGGGSAIFKVINQMLIPLQ